MLLLYIQQVASSSIISQREKRLLLLLLLFRIIVVRSPPCHTHNKTVLAINSYYKAHLFSRMNITRCTPIICYFLGLTRAFNCDILWIISSSLFANQLKDLNSTSHRIVVAHNNKKQNMRAIREGACMNTRRMIGGEIVEFNK